MRWLLVTTLLVLVSCTNRWQIILIEDVEDWKKTGKYEVRKVEELKDKSGNVIYEVKYRYKD